MRKYLAFIFINLYFFNLAQTSQMVRGRIFAENSGRAIEEASITLSGIISYSTVTDSAGEYFLKVSPDRYSILVEHLGFKSMIRENIVVNSAKQQVEDFSLQELQVTLDSVIIAASPVTDFVIEQWHLQQYAAVFYDPARVISSHAAVINTNDQANHISVRGTSPNYIQWKVEGVEVTNPNHLENSGTLNDRPSFNGGGVSMISAQLLQSSGFQFAPFDPLSGNALSGIFDMKLRNGNDEKNERVVQVSLLGTDLSLEGPLTKKKNTSYLINFRYSTIGLLSKLGINFGDEQTNYFDFSHHFTFSHKHGTVKIFGIAGSSQTLFQAKTDTAKIEFEKDLQNIDYRSLTFIEGISFLTNISNTMFFKTVVAFSEKKIIRDANVIREWAGLNSENDFYNQQKISTVNYLSKRINHTFRLRIGSYLNYFKNSMRNTGPVDINNSLDEPVAEPFLSVEGTIFRHLEVRAGLHGFYQARINYFNLQPRFMAKFNLSDEQYISFNYGNGAQMQPFFLYLSHDLNKNLKPTLNTCYSLAHSISFRTNKIKTEIFYQHYTQVPEQPTMGFSTFNYFNEQIYLELTQQGTATTYGIDLSYDKHFRGFYILASVGVYNSYFSNGTGDHAARFNSGYNTALTGGKEFRMRNRNNFFGIDLRGVRRNGFFENNPEPDQYNYSVRLPNYARLDLRLSFRKNKQKSASIWAIDIQNVTNRKNIAYRYNDRYTNQTETRYQLGLIPVLSYKVMF